MEENQNSNPNPTVSTEKSAVVAVSRPWQGTFLAVLDIIGLVIIGIFIPVLLFGASLLVSVLPAAWAGMTMVIALIFVGLWVLELFIVIGLFKGQKWVLFVSIVFSALALIGGFYPTINFFTLLMNGFMLYLAYACLNHPFYNKK